MIKFSMDKVRLEYVRVKSVTEALGGSVQVVDEQQSKLKGHDVTKRYSIPYSVARAYKQRRKGKSTFFIPVDMCLVWYDDIIVQIEQRPYSLDVKSQVTLPDTWESNSEYCLKHIVGPMINKDVDDGHVDKWCTDGSYIYRMPNNYRVADDHPALTEDGRFRNVVVSAITWSQIHFIELCRTPSSRSCVMFVAGNGRKYFSAPVWGDVMDIRKTSLSAKVDADRLERFRFDELQKKFFINVEFSLYCAQVLGTQFGYEHIKPLCLDELMISLNTVNLPKVNKSIRQTFDTGMQFNTTLAWLIGYSRACTKLSQYAAIRGCIKMLCKNGLFDRSRSVALLSTVAPPTIDRDMALQNIHLKYSDAHLATYWLNNKLEKDITGHVDQVVRTNIIGEIE